MKPANDLVLLYDGVCGFCDHTVRFVLEHDSVRTMKFAPLQGDFAKGVMVRHPSLQGVDSLVLVRSAGTAQERVVVRSEAVLEVAVYLGIGRYTVACLRAVPRVIRDGAYALFAHFRYFVFGKYESCRVPTSDERARFLADATQSESHELVHKEMPRR